MGELSLEAVWSRYQRAKARRRCWEGLWRECYTYALPQRGTGFGAEFRPGANPVERLFDGTALDAVEQLGASLLAELTPPWSQWFGLIPGRDVGPLATRRGRRGAGPRARRRSRPISTAPTSRSRSISASSIWSRWAPRPCCSRRRRSAALSAFRLSAGADDRGRVRGGAGRPDRRSFPRAQPASRPAAGALSRGRARRRPQPSCEAGPERAVAVVEAVLPQRRRLRLLRAARR